jgi:hypothetical protein
MSSIRIMPEGKDEPAVFFLTDRDGKAVVEGRAVGLPACYRRRPLLVRRCDGGPRANAVRAGQSQRADR